MKKLAFHISIITLLVFSSCSWNEFKCQSDEPKHLIGEFKSFQTYFEFEKLVEGSCDSIIVFENSSLSETDTRPQFSIYTVIIPGFLLETEIGQLRASFFNDRLMSVWFYPKNAKNLEEKLKTNCDIELKMNGKLELDCVEIIRWKDFEKKEYFGWSDLKLVNEMNAWISKYA